MDVYFLVLRLFLLYLYLEVLPCFTYHLGEKYFKTQIWFFYLDSIL